MHFSEGVSILVRSAAFSITSKCAPEKVCRKRILFPFDDVCVFSLPPMGVEYLWEWLHGLWQILMYFVLNNLDRQVTPLFYGYRCLSSCLFVRILARPHALTNVFQVLIGLVS